MPRGRSKSGASTKLSAPAFVISNSPASGPPSAKPVRRSPVSWSSAVTVPACRLFSGVSNAASPVKTGGSASSTTVTVASAVTVIARSPVPPVAATVTRQVLEPPPAPHLGFSKSGGSRKASQTVTPSVSVSNRLSSGPLSA